jgi:hypothetical protein
MIVIITTDEEVHAVLSKAGKKPIDLAALELEYNSFIQGADVESKLAKDESNLTKSGTVRKDVLRKELKKRQVTFEEFLVEQKKFKMVDHIVFDY